MSLEKMKEDKTTVNIHQKIPQGSTIIINIQDRRPEEEITYRRGALLFGQKINDYGGIYSSDKLLNRIEEEFSTNFNSKGIIARLVDSEEKEITNSPEKLKKHLLNIKKSEENIYFLNLSIIHGIRDGFSESSPIVKISLYFQLKDYINDLVLADGLIEDYTSKAYDIKLSADALTDLLYGLTISSIIKKFDSFVLEESLAAVSPEAMAIEPKISQKSTEETAVKIKEMRQEKELYLKYDKYVERDPRTARLLSVFPGFILPGSGYLYAGDYKRFEGAMYLRWGSVAIPAALFWSLFPYVIIDSNTLAALTAGLYLGAWAYEIIDAPNFVKDENENYKVAKEKGIVKEFKPVYLNRKFGLEALYSMQVYNIKSNQDFYGYGFKNVLGYEFKYKLSPGINMVISYAPLSGSAENLYVSGGNTYSEGNIKTDRWRLHLELYPGEMGERGEIAREYGLQPYALVGYSSNSLRENYIKTSGGIDQPIINSGNFETLDLGWGMRMWKGTFAMNFGIEYPIFIRQTMLNSETGLSIRPGASIGLSMGVVF